MLKTMELFAGVGGFRVGLERSGDIQVVWGNQWEPFKKKQDAFDCYVKNFQEKGIHSNKDITTVNAGMFQHMGINLIVGGFPCFVAGTKITTKHGLKNIEFIKAGDLVLTHTNTYKRVVKPMKRETTGIYRLEVEGVPHHFVTKEHPYYVRQYQNGKWTKPEWIAVKDLDKEKHFVAYTGKNKMISGTRLDGVCWVPIKALTYLPNWKGMVYNMEVEEDNSYIANHLIVHNCQDYSVARSLSSEKGIEGKKGVLFWEIIRFVQKIKPQYLLLENVDRLLKSPSKQRGRDFSIMLAAFRDEGYQVEWRVINAADYGNAQRRKRIFIFACQQQHPFCQDSRHQHPHILLHQSGFFAPIFPVEQDQAKTKVPQEFTLPEDILEISNSFSTIYWNAGIMREGVVYTEELTPIPEPPILLGDILEKGVAERFYLTPEQYQKFQYLKGAKKIPRISPSGHEYTYSEGPVAFPDPLDKPGRTMLTSEGSVNRSTHIVCDPETGRLRRLTPVECERLNGFPDHWTEGMSERMRYFCMGNALVVPLVERMGKRLLEIEKRRGMN